MHVILPEGQVGDDGEAAVKSYKVAEPDNIEQYKIPTPESPTQKPGPPWIGKHNLKNHSGYLRRQPQN